MHHGNATRAVPRSERFYNAGFLAGGLLGIFLGGAAFVVFLNTTLSREIPTVFMLVCTFAVGLTLSTLAVQRARKEPNFFAGLCLGFAGVPLALPLLFLLSVVLHVDI